jgi:hypothetical protein
MANPVEPPTNTAEQLQPNKPVVVLQKYILTPVASRGDVVESTS